MKKHLFIISSSLAISILHYITPTSLHHFHAIYQRLYYIPIIFASYLFGVKKGLLYAVFCGLLYTPHIFFQWSFDSHQSFTQYVEISMFLVISALVGFLSDIQQKQKNEIIKQQKELLRADRLSLLGKLAAGLAHELRNPLSSLMGSVEILRKDLEPGYKRIEFVRILDKELKRLNKKLNEFLFFAKSRPLELIPNNINDIINAMLTMLETRITSNNITVKKDLDGRIPLVRMDSEQIKQVLLNLVLNSIEAMPSGGALRLSTHYSENHLSLTIEDNGPGIPPQDKEKIFDPFFTTKSDGTGLGLSIVKQIIERHNGSIKVFIKQGLRFEIRIPNAKA
ncbi:MAG: ATP-binding protein [bacterium]